MKSADVERMVLNNKGIKAEIIAVGYREEAGVLKVREFVYICFARPPRLRQSARRKHQNFTDFNDSKHISNAHSKVC